MKDEKVISHKDFFMTEVEEGHKGGPNCRICAQKITKEESFYKMFWSKRAYNGVHKECLSKWLAAMSLKF